VSFIQNHDQIGNRAFGERLSVLAPSEAIRALASVYLLSPQIPMLFMGEEWGATEPFLFFCDYEGALAEAVRNGRREEFSHFPEFADPERVAKIPDPCAQSTFLASKLDWSRIDAEHLAFYRELLKTRRDFIRPLLPSIRHGGEALVVGEQAVRVTWRARERRLLLDANLSPSRVEFPPVKAPPFWLCGDAGANLGPWAVRWAIEPA
jgi:maltooligosyltrehalose trehalohydrolase